MLFLKSLGNSDIPLVVIIDLVFLQWHLFHHLHGTVLSFDKFFWGPLFSKNLKIVKL